MGIFGSRKKTVVASVAYNLAGDVLDRPNFLKTTVLSQVLYDTTNTMGQTITNSYLRGPGMTLPRFAKWARTSGFNDAIGQIGSNIVVGGSINEEVLIANTTHGADESVSILLKKITWPDYSWWAEQWMLENHPDQFEEEWEADMIGTTQITITMPGGSPVYTFPVTNWDLEQQYLYYVYSLSKHPALQPLVLGTPVDVSSGSFPSVTGWTQVSRTVESKTLDLVKTTVIKKSYSDGRPDEMTTTTEDSTGTYDEIHGVYTRTTYKGNWPSDPNKTYSTQETMYQDQTGSVGSSSTSDTKTEDIGGGVTMTTLTTVTTEAVKLSKIYRIDSQDTVVDGVGESHIRIYQKGTGVPAFDAMFDATTDTGTFYPFIPIRLNNQFVSPSYFPTIYEASKKGYKKAFGRNYFDKLIDIIDDNESIGDIDYAYITFGVSLNVIDNSALRYVFEFFSTVLSSFAAASPEVYEAYRTEWIKSRDSVTAWETWKAAQSTPTDPLYGTRQPDMIPYPAMPNQEIQIKNGDQYNIRIAWDSMEETAGIGPGKVGAKRGDLWWEMGPVRILNGKLPSSDGFFSSMLERSGVVHLWFQETNTSWRKITFSGLKHINTIYKGKAVEIEADEALIDNEESGFVVPLHEGIFKSMRLVDRTQAATANSFILFNCYKTVKKKWYQTGLFKVIIVIIAIVITICFPPAGGAAGGTGVLGANAAVGAAVGIAAGTLAAVIVGAIINAIAAMLIVTIIQRGAVALFGDKLGTIIGAIAAVVALNVAGGMANGQTMAQSFGNLTRADSILALTNAVGDGYAAYVQADTLDVLNRTETLMSEYNTEAKEIQDQFLQMFGTAGGVIDPMRFTQAAQIVPESRDSFLARTLLLGSEIVELSTALLDNFTEISLTTDLPT